MRKLVDILRDPVIQLLLMLSVVIMIGISIAAPNADRGQPNYIRVEAGGMVWAALTSTPTETPWPTVTAWLDGQPTAMSTQTPIPWQTDAPTAIPTAWLVTVPTNWAGDSSNCSCVANIYNCDDFGLEDSAQACLEKCRDETGSDIHDLDRDNDGLACEVDR